MKYVFGIDVGGTTVKMGLFETTGTLLDKWEMTTRTEQNGRYILSDIAKSLEQKMQQHQITKADVLGAGIGVPGPVTADGMVNHCVNLGWGKKYVTTELAELTGFSVKAGNDATLAALGEVWQGSGVGYQDVLLVTVGTGIGGGLVIDGHIVTGATGSGAEIGHICVNPHETKSCSCGKKGCLEQYTSATGIVRMAKKRLASSQTHSVLQDMQDFTAKDVIDAAKAGDILALEVVDSMAKTMGLALASCCAVADVALFIIGGGVSKAGDFLLNPIQKYYRMFAFHTQTEAKFRLAKLGNDAGIYGAACLII